jgi:hypothetical protein
MTTVNTGFDTTTNKELFKKLIKDTFDNTDRDAILESAKLYSMESSSDLYERDLRMAGLPTGQALTEGEAPPIWSPKIGQTKDYTQAEYGLGFRFTDLFRRTNKYNLAEKWTRNLKMKMRELKDIELAKLWNSPTATYTGYDTQVLGYASHTCLDDASSTYDNILSAALSVTALESAAYYFETLKDDQGATFFAKPDVLYYHPALDTTINEITGSSLRPHELSNTTNVFKGRFEPYMYHRLSSTTAWGLCATKDKNYDVKCYTLYEPDVVTGPAFDYTRDTVITSKQAFTWGFGDGRTVLIGNT